MKRFTAFLLDAFDESIFFRILMLALAIGAASACGFLSLCAGAFAAFHAGGVADPVIPATVTTAALIRILDYLCAATLCYGGYKILFVPEDIDLKIWACVIVGPVLIQVLPASFVLSGALPLAALWGTCLLLLAMMGSGLWVIRSWRMNQWAAELSELKTENEMRRAVRENGGNEDEV